MDTATSNAVSVTAGARTYGSYTQIDAATAHEYDAFYLLAWEAGTAGLVGTVAIGGSGSEVAIATDIPLHMPSTRRQLTSVYLPVNVPAGSRLSVKLSRDTGTSGTATVGILGIQGGVGFPVGFQRATGYGLTASFGYSTATASASANTLGSYGQITASTANNMKALTFALHSTSSTTSTNLLNLAVGGAGSETVILANVPLYIYASTAQTNVVSYGPLPCNIPSGTRLAANLQSSVGSTAINARVAVIGFD